MSYTGKFAALVAASTLAFSGLGFSPVLSMADETASVTKVALSDGDEKAKGEEHATEHMQKMKERHGAMSGDMKKKHDAMSDEMKEKHGAMSGDMKKKHHAMSDEMKEKMKERHKKMHEEMAKDDETDEG